MNELYSDTTPEYIVINMTDPSGAISLLYEDIAVLTAERDELREAAQAVVAERHNVDSAYHLFAKVNVLKLSALAALLPNTGGE